MKLTQTHVIGEAIEDREFGWQGHIEFTDWLDEEHIIYCNTAGQITCLNLESGSQKWQLEVDLSYGKFSLCRKRGVLAVLSKCEPDNRLCVIDCDSGQLLADLDNTALAKLLGIDRARPTNIALTPITAKLVITCFGMAFGKNGYILSSDLQSVERKFDADGFVCRLSVSPDESRLTMLADKYTVSIYDLPSDEWLFLRGERVYVKQNSVEGDSRPGINCVFHDGKDTVIYNSDGGLCGAVFLHSLSDETVTSLNALNAHNELDVDFSNRRIAITGTGMDIMMQSFEGDELAFFPNASIQRNTCIKFSPSFRRLAVGSWDNTVSIYEISDEYDPDLPTYYGSTAVDFSDFVDEASDD